MKVELANDIIVGGGSDDLLIGDDGDDVIVGQFGDDTILGLGGNDLIWGGFATDRDGDFGDDDVDEWNRNLGYGQPFFIVDETANFELPLNFEAAEAQIPTGFIPPNITPVALGGITVNGTQPVNFNPGDGEDILRGGDGKDWIFGGGESDDIEGGLKSDYLDGGASSDFLLGNEGDDIIRGGLNSDVLRGAAGIDQLYGDDGDDFLFWRRRNYGYRLDDGSQRRCVGRGPHRQPGQIQNPNQRRDCEFSRSAWRSNSGIRPCGGKIINHLTNYYPR